MTPQSPETPEPLPACRATADRLNRVLDGELAVAALAADPHPASCPACRERVAAAQLLLAVLANPEPVVVPSGMTDRILAAVQADRQAEPTPRGRRRVVAFAAVAVAAAVFLAVWLPTSPDAPKPDGTPRTPEVAKATPAPEVAPEPPPIRIGDELAKAGAALRGAPRTITDPAGSAPDMLSKLTDALTRPLAPMEDMGPARAALADLPDAARAGLEPVTGTAQKAFSRLMRDVTAIGSKPKS